MRESMSYRVNLCVPIKMSHTSNSVPVPTCDPQASVHHVGNRYLLSSDLQTSPKPIQRLLREKTPIKEEASY